jgi:hypothetical protein
MDYLTLETPPVDGTHEPETGDFIGVVNGVPDEIEVATEEDLLGIIEQEGRAIEPEIAASRPTEPVSYRGGARSYVSDHPTRFDWRPDVARAIKRVQAKFPQQTFANTYVWHPPYNPPIINTRHDAVSVDFWGGGVSRGRYVGYRGKPIGTALGHKVWHALFYDPHLPNIAWIIWNGRMWVRGRGWSRAPGGPPDSDAGHHKHVHCTFQ